MIPWTIQSMEFSRPEYLSRWLLPSMVSSWPVSCTSNAQGGAGWGIPKVPACLRWSAFSTWESVQPWSSSQGNGPWSTQKHSSSMWRDHRGCLERAGEMGHGRVSEHNGSPFHPHSLCKAYFHTLVHWTYKRMGEGTEAQRAQITCSRLLSQLMLENQVSWFPV